MANDRVFGSDITRTLNDLNNNLYDLLTVNPVKPLPKNEIKYLSCDFVPKTDKYFIPKRKLRPKVKTVRDIRNIFEKDVCNNLSVDIEKQQSVLLRKIRGGSSKDEKTILFARNLIKSEKPISRTAWQMIININPNNYPHPSQYVLWNGKCVQVNGSTGGKSKFIYKYDLGERRASLLQRDKVKKGDYVAKKYLLKHSLNVKFKPGPLSRKKQLDTSYQKYNIGNVELAQLPKPGLDILPEYGKPIEASVANFLHNLRDKSGIISDKWAEFAVSALGTNDNGHAVQLNKDCVTFDLGYLYDQRQLLMRYDVDELFSGQIKEQTLSNFSTENEEITTQEVQKVLNDMLISVEINLMENKVYTGEDSPRKLDTGDMNNSCDSQPKDKVKRKGQSELHRLDVTVIRLCDNSQETKGITTCQKSFCTLGCICDSLLSPFRLKTHCGYIECMFECKCDFSKYNLHSYFENDIIPGLVNLDKKNNSKLSKEEQKFHQTVILSGEKSILLKSRRRNWKAPEKYADFYSNMCLKTKKDIKRVLSVVEVKLNCGNIEPWCMIHNLYKCFCKGKFTEKLSINVSNDESKTIDSEQKDTELRSLENIEAGFNCKSNEFTKKSILRPRMQHVAGTDDVNNKLHSEKKIILPDHSYRQCARVIAYKKRKYSDTFYLNTNKRIMELEQNDQGLQKRMMEILNHDDGGDIKKPKNNSGNLSAIELSSSPIPEQTTQITETLDESKGETQNILPTGSTYHKLSGDIITTQFTSPTERNLNKKLIAWLEPCLKLYKQRFAKGFFKSSLEPPAPGKIALYPWDFIVSRYQERKNIFMVTKQKPCRIFIAIDYRNALFNNCINIRTIDDLDKYPISVKNIIRNEVDWLTDHLCILRGLNFCWELMGSVRKVCDLNNTYTESNVSESSSDGQELLLQNHTTCTNSPATPDNNTSSSISVESKTEQSKWFVMTIENDFTEIQFYKRGFFVKYDNIIKAINVARISDKTVRLSSQKCNEGSSDPQFGIYAVPNVNEYCVFIGPYENHESLGIETIKNALRNQKAKTRGVWITTNKVDNLQVIDNPLSFMSQVNLEKEQTLDDSTQLEVMIDAASSTEITNVDKGKEKKVVKLVKPIKITKTNNFYHLTPSGFLKPISVSPEKPTCTTPLIIKKRLSLDLDASTTNLPLKSRTQLNENQKYLHVEEKQKASSKKPIAEIAPQVKDCNTDRRKFEGGMFILKPEEINSRSLINGISLTTSPMKNTVSLSANDEVDMDIENFLTNSVECSAPNADVYVISDDEDYCTIETSKQNCWKDVWIICESVKKLGWICGRQNSDGDLSFEFPGFKYSEFYAEEEAFSKITQVLARKIYIPEHVKLKWSVVTTKKKLKGLEKLKQEELTPAYVFTKNGLMHKKYIPKHYNKKSRTKNASETKCTANSSHNAKAEENVDLEHMKNRIDAMDVESNLLLEEGEQLLNETLLKRDELSDNFIKMSNDRRQKVSDRLRRIISS